MGPKDEPAEPEEDAAAIDFGKKRKNKTGDKEKKEKSDKKEKAKPGGAEEDGAIFVETEFERGAVYEYEDLLARVHKIMENQNPNIGDRKKYVMKPPQVVRVGSKKVGWVNFREICELMGRTMEHVQTFACAELGATANLAGDGQLILKGRFTESHLEKLLRKYITEYITCHMCKSPKTELSRDASTRLWKVACQNCGADRNKEPIKSGYHATTRADRRAARFAT